MHILIFLAVVLFALPCAPSPRKGRTIRKVIYSYILHKFQEDRQESILCAKHQLFE